MMKDGNGNRVKLFCIFSVILLLLVGSAVPCVSANASTYDEQKVKELTEKFDSIINSRLYTLLKRIHDKHIDVEVYEANYNFMLDSLTEISPLIDPPLYDLFQRIAIWSTLIVDFVMIFFGHNPVGLALGYLVAIVMVSPIILFFDFLWSADETSNFVGIFVDALFPSGSIPSIEDLIDMFGIFGFIFFCVMVVPVIFITWVVWTCLTVVACIPGFFITYIEFLSIMDEYYNQNPPW